MTEEAAVSILSFVAVVRFFLMGVVGAHDQSSALSVIADHGFSVFLGHFRQEAVIQRILVLLLLKLILQSHPHRLSHFLDFRGVSLSECACVVQLLHGSQDVGARLVQLQHLLSSPTVHRGTHHI